MISLNCLTVINPCQILLYYIVGYKLRLQVPETMKLFGSTKRSIDEIKIWENVPSLKVFDVVLVQLNLLDHQYQQKFEVLCIFKPSNSYAHLLNVEPSNLVFF